MAGVGHTSHGIRAHVPGTYMPREPQAGFAGPRTAVRASSPPCLMPPLSPLLALQITRAHLVQRWLSAARSLHRGCSQRKGRRTLASRSECVALWPVRAVTSPDTSSHSAVRCPCGRGCASTHTCVSTSSSWRLATCRGWEVMPRGPQRRRPWGQALGVGVRGVARGRGAAQARGSGSWWRTRVQRRQSSPTRPQSAPPACATPPRRSTASPPYESTGRAAPPRRRLAGRPFALLHAKWVLTPAPPPGLPDRSTAAF